MRHSRRLIVGLLGLTFALLAAVMSPVSAQTDTPDQADAPDERAEPGFDPYEVPGAEQPIGTSTAVPSGGDIDVIPTPPIIDVEAAKQETETAASPAPLLPDEGADPIVEEVPLNQANREFDGTGISIRTPRPQRSARAQAANPKTATIETLPADKARQLSNVDTAFTLHLDGYNANPSTLNAPRVPGFPIPRDADIDLGEESGWRLTIDATNLPADLTREQQDRIRIFVHANCDKALECAITEELPTEHKADGTVVVQLETEVIKAVGGPDDVRRLRAPGLFGNMTATYLNASGFALQTGGDSVYFSAGTVAAGVQNDYTASAVTSLATWQVGLQTGHAETSYSVPIPPSIGPMPDVSYSYSSGTVDGMTIRTANQGGIVGLGWSSAQPVISRATRGCASSTGSTGIDNDGAWEGEQCFAYPNDPTRGFSLSMGGVGGRLVPFGAANQPHLTVANATYQRFVTETLNDMRILLVTSTALTPSNRGSYGQWWEVTTSDGTLYIFGRDHIFRTVAPIGDSAPLAVPRVADETRRTNSAQVIPVANANEICGGNNLCDTVINWHLDQIIDSNGNMATYEYWRNTNHYNQADGAGQVAYKPYDMSINLDHVDYGQTFNQNSELLAKSAPASAQRLRVQFDFAYRTEDGTESTTLANWVETPIDLVCNGGGFVYTGGTCEDSKSPALFNTIRLIRATTFVGGARGSYVLFGQQFPDPTDAADNPTPIPATDNSARKMWLSQIQRRGHATADVMPALTFTREWLANTVSSDTVGGSMTMPRIGSLKTELGGVITYTYGQPGGREPSSTVATTHDCYSGLNDPNGYIRTGCYMFQQMVSAEDNAGNTQAGVLLFNKWVVTNITEDAGLNGHSAISSTDIDYLANPDWAYTEQWGFTATDLGTTSNHCEYGYGCNYWSDYRGHAQVLMTQAGGNQTMHYFFTGMRDDRGWTNDIDPLWQFNLAAPENVTKLPAGGTSDNFGNRRGSSIGTQTFVPDGSDAPHPPPAANSSLGFTNQLHNYAVVVAESAHWPGSVRVTNQFAVTKVRERRGLSSDYFQLSEVRTFFDSDTRMIRIEDRGLFSSSTVDPLPDDDVTMCFAYPSTSDAIDASWIISKPWKTATLPSRNTTCDGQSNFPAPSTWMAGTETVFDVDALVTTAATAAVPSRGNATATHMFVSQETPTAWTGTIATYTSQGLVDTTKPLHAPDVERTTYGYNSYGHVATVDGPLAHDTVSTETNNHWGVPTQTIAPNSQANGYSNLVTSLTYDTLGRVKTVTTPGATQTTHLFDYSLSNDSNATSYVKTRVLREAGSYLTSYAVMDGLGRTVQNQSVDASLNQLRISTQHYGQLGEVSLSVNPVLTSLGGYGGLLGYSNGSQGYVNGYVTTSINPQLSNTMVEQFNVAGVAQSISEREVRGLVETTDVNGIESTTTSDMRGNIIISTAPAGATSFSYNRRNEVISIDGPETGDGDTITYNYPNYQTQPSSIVDPSLGTVAYTYDDQGRLETQSDGNANTLWMSYNNAGQPTQIKQGSSTGALVTSYGYDSTGRQTSSSGYNRMPDGESKGIVTSTFGYHASRGYANATTLDIPGLTPQTRSIDLRQTGAIGTVTYPDGTVSSYTYDAAENQATFSHDGDVLASLRNAPGVPNFNARGQLTGFNAGGSNTSEAAAETILGYEPWSGSLTSKTATAPNSDNLANYAYSWDVHGNLEQLADTTDGINQTSCFSYDTSQRLTEGYTTTGNCTTGTQNTGPTPFDVSYTYTAGGNINTAYGTGTVNGAYWYGGSGGPNAVNAASNNAYRYSYSAGGNQINRKYAGEDYTYFAYDVRNRMVGITGEGTDLSALYDAAGNRVRRTLDGEVTYYIGEGYEIQPASLSPLSSDTNNGGGGSTTTTTTQATTSTTQATTTTTAGGGGGSTTTTAPAALSVLYVVNNPASLTATEVRVNDHFIAQGHTVTLRDANDPEDPATYDLIVIGHGGGLGQKYETLATPILELQPSVWANQGMITGSVSYDWGDEMTITNSSSSLAAGLSGTVSFLASSSGIATVTGTQFGSGSPDVIALFESSSSKHTYFAYDGGDVLADGSTAAGRRVVLSGLHNTNVTPTVSGWVLLDAAVDWATNNTNNGGGGGTTTTTTQATTTTQPTTTTTAGGGGGSTTTTAPAGSGNTTPTKIVRISHSFNGQMVGVSVNGEFTLTVTDHLGSSGTNREADGTTTVQKYTPFGALRTSAENLLLSDWTFTGQTDDPGTGLIDYNARHYDPQLGRFIMADSVLDGLNRYSYVRNNPLNAIDPTGHSWGLMDWLPQVMNGWRYHHAIEADVMSKIAGWDSERNAKGGRSSPRADLINPTTGQIIEIKTANEGAASAHAQNRAYILAWDPESNKVCEDDRSACALDIVERPADGNSAFSGVIKLGPETLTYSQTDKGVILYTVEGLAPQGNDLFNSLRELNALRKAVQAYRAGQAAAAATAPAAPAPSMLRGLVSGASRFFFPPIPMELICPNATSNGCLGDDDLA